MKKIKIYAIIGKAGSGKDFILKKLLRNINAKEIISYTSRPPREGEVDGKNYHFVTSDYFEKQGDDFIEKSFFNGWYYGTRYSDLDMSKPNIGVFNPEGIHSLLQNKQIDLHVIELCVSDKIRLIRQLQREENPDIVEIFRRYNTDNADFNWYHTMIAPNIAPEKRFYINNDANGGMDVVYDIVDFIKKAENREIN